MLGLMVQTLSLLLTAILAGSQGKPDVPLPIHGITDRSVDLILREEWTGPIREIYWTFQTFILAVFLNNHLDIKYKEFENRLEILDNGSSLRISDLRKEDGGIYHVSVLYTDRTHDSASYILTVYDPVPSPCIQTECNENTAERCNVTLHCSVPSNTSNTSDFSYSWKSRHQDSTYQPYSIGRTTQISLPPDHQDSTYQLYSNGCTTQISLPPDHQDMELLCIVQNPADQKNVSINVRHICPHLLIRRQSKSGGGRHYFMLLLIPLALTVIFGLFLLKRYKKSEIIEKQRRKESKEMPEIHYADLALGANSSEQRSSPKNKESTKETVYSTVVG